MSATATNPRLLFFHIAKTGGLSIRRILSTSLTLNSYDCFHNGDLLEIRAGSARSRHVDFNLKQRQYDVALYVSRNPMDRLASCYQYFIHGGLNQFHHRKSPHDAGFQDFLLRTAPTFRSCCELLAEVSCVIPHFRPASDWLKVLPQPLANNVIECRFSSFQADLKQALQCLGLPPLQPIIPHLNKSTNHQGIITTTDYELALIRQFYQRDLELFGYEV